MRVFLAIFLLSALVCAIAGRRLYLTKDNQELMSISDSGTCVASDFVTNQNASLSCTASAVQDLIRILSSNITNLTNKVNALQATVNTVQTTVNTVQTTVNTLQTTVNNVRDEMRVQPLKYYFVNRTLTNKPFVVPAGVRSIEATMYGAGADGGGRSSPCGGGGGSGAFGVKYLSVTPGSTLLLTVNSAETSIKSSGVVLARVFAGGTTPTSSGGAGGDIDVVDYGFRGSFGGGTSSSAEGGAPGILTCPAALSCPWSDMRFYNGPGQFAAIQPVIASGGTGSCSTYNAPGGSGLLILSM